MKNNLFVLMALFLFAGCFSSCSIDKGPGILGIEVPIGNGKVSEETPYIISGVYEDTPAFKAGIKPGDLIMQINGMPVSKGMRFDDIFTKQLTGKAGTKVTIIVKRAEETLVFEVVRAERGN